MTLDLFPARAGTPGRSPARPGTQIRLERITKRFGHGAPAVDDVSLTVEPGELMTFLGPSGSGKTTTLNLIAGFESPDAGAILIDGQDVSAVPPHRRNLGVLFQNYALFPHMTVARNVGYPLRERRVGRAEVARRVREVLDLVQLRGRDDAYPAQLSGGQQQRVALARAIVFEPRALLLDEPLSALDRNLRTALQLEIRRIHRKVGATLVFVTHDQDEAMVLSDRVALFNEGRIEQVDTPDGLYDRPETLFAARFLGDSNVFLLEAGVTGTSARWEDECWTVEPRTVSARAAACGGRGAIVVRPEAVSVCPDRTAVPPGANAVEALVHDVEYLGTHRTLVLGLGKAGVGGRAQLASSDTSFGPGDRLTAWWRPAAQRVVAA